MRTHRLLTTVAPVGENFLEWETDITGVTDRLVHQLGIMFVRGVNCPAQNKSVLVNNNANFYSLDLFVPIETIVTRTVAPFHTLGIQYAHGREFQLVAFLAYPHDCLFNLMFNMSVLPLFAEVFVNGLPFGKFHWEHPSLASADKQIEDSLKNLTQGIFSVTTIIFKEYFVNIRPLTHGLLCLI